MAVAGTEHWTFDGRCCYSHAFNICGVLLAFKHAAAPVDCVFSSHTLTVCCKLLPTYDTSLFIINQRVLSCFWRPNRKILTHIVKKTTQQFNQPLTRHLAYLFYKSVSSYRKVTADCDWWRQLSLVPVHRYCTHQIVSEQVQIIIICSDFFCASSRSSVQLPFNLTAAEVTTASAV